MAAEGETVAGARGAAGSGHYGNPVLIKSARTRIKKLGNGQPVVESSSWQSLGAWAVDFSLVAVLAAVASAAVAGPAWGTPGEVVAAAITVWIAAPWLYGFCCPNGLSLGSLASGTVVVRFTTGGRLGRWRAGWVMFTRMVLFPVVIFIVVLAAAGGSSPSGGGPRIRYLTLDRRFPVPPPPVHPDVLRAAAEDAAARHSQLPGLYDREGQHG